MANKVRRGWLVAAAWACLGGSAVAQPPADADPSPLAAALFPTPAPASADGFDPALARYLTPPPGWFVQSEADAASLSVAAGGIHIAADGTWALGQTGLSLCVGADGGLLVGREDARYSYWANPADSVFGPRASDRGTALLGTFNARAGAQYVVPWRRGSLRLGAGYQFETWGAWRSRSGGGDFGSVSPGTPPGVFDSFSWQSHGVYLSCEFAS